MNPPPVFYISGEGLCAVLFSFFIICKCLNDIFGEKQFPEQPAGGCFLFAGKLLEGETFGDEFSQGTFAGEYFIAMSVTKDVRESTCAERKESVLQYAHTCLTAGGDYP